MAFSRQTIRPPPRNSSREREEPPRRGLTSRMGSGAERGVLQDHDDPMEPKGRDESGHGPKTFIRGDFRYREGAANPTRGSHAPQEEPRLCESEWS